MTVASIICTAASHTLFLATASPNQLWFKYFSTTSPRESFVVHHKNGVSMAEMGQNENKTSAAVPHVEFE